MAAASSSGELGGRTHDEGALRSVERARSHSSVGALLSTHGPIAEAQSSCARYVDGHSRCVEEKGNDAIEREPFGDASVHAMSIRSWPSHACVVDDDGSVLCTQPLASANSPVVHANEPVIVRVAGLPHPARAVATEIERACALLDDGDVWCWRNDALPARIESVRGAVALGAGGAVGCVLISTGALACFTMPK